MKYDFETLVNRRDKYSRKWQVMDEYCEGVCEDVLPFSVADYDLKYPNQLIDKFKDYIDNMIFGYSAVDDFYYQSFINWVKRRHFFEIKQEWIVNGTGVISGIVNSIRAFSEIDDGVIILTPVYPPFFHTVKNSQRKLVECPLINEDGYYKINFDLLEKECAKAENKILIMCSPHNPVGRVWSKTELVKLAKICNQHNILVISDEIHMDILIDDFKHTIYSSIDDASLNNSVILTSASKSFNLAGANTSFVIIANQDKREAYKNYVAKNCAAHLNAFGFKLFEIAYNDCEDWFDGFLDLITHNFKFAQNYLHLNLPKIKVSPLQGTYLMWLDLRYLGLSDDQLLKYLAKECKIFVNKGESYGKNGSGFIRFNLATPSLVLKRALENLKTGLDKLN